MCFYTYFIVITFLCHENIFATMIFSDYITYNFCSQSNVGAFWVKNCQPDPVGQEVDFKICHGKFLFRNSSYSWEALELSKQKFDEIPWVLALKDAP